MPQEPQTLTSASAGDGDGEAIARTLAGDRRAFESVVSRHENAVYTLLLNMTGSVEDAQDMAQEAFLRAYRFLAQFDLNRPFRPWILRIATNAAHEHARRHRRSPTIPLEDMQDAIADESAASPPDELSRKQEADLFNRAVQGLRGEPAALYHLRYREQLAVETIAETLGKRPNTVSVALHRLRQHLKQTVHSLIKSEDS